jgi:6-phosphofructokinase 1
MPAIKRVAVLTSGGDAPGMNAAIRAVVRTGLSKGYEMFGVRQGYAGLINGDLRPMGPREVGGIMQQGGTVLGSARSPEFRTEDGRRRALRELNRKEIHALVVIGGNGSQAGAYELSKLDFPVVGVASTIDNDLYGSEITIGVDTALNIALEAVDRLRVTASSHHRAFLVEVMGRDCGYLALMTAVAGGAEMVVIPEYETTPEQVAQVLSAAYERGKAHGLIIVAEGAQHSATELENFLKEAQLGFEVRATTLGHVQRGGTPSAADRILASRLGAGAIEALARGETGVLVGIMKGEVTTTPHEEVIKSKKPLDERMLQLAQVLAK